jgi:hypothetical protein
MKDALIKKNSARITAKLPDPSTISPDPSAIMHVALGFWQSKTLLAAVKLEIFTLLDNSSLTGEQIQTRLGLDSKYAFDFLDALVSLGFLEREGNGTLAKYSNTNDTAFFLDKKKPQYIGGFLEMANDREYKFWGDLEEGLKTGKPQNEIKYTGKSSFEAIYESPQRLKQFTDAMSGIQKGSFSAFAEKFDFTPYSSLLDAGGSAGLLSALVAAKNPHMHCTTLDLPQLEPFALETSAQLNVGNRVTVRNGDFFKDPFPKADIITMGNILHSFDLPSKKMLIQKAFDALPDNGCLVVIETIMDNERRKNSFALLMSLNMLIESDGGFNYTEAQYDMWTKEAGFKKTRFIHLAGPVSAGIAYK